MVLENNGANDLSTSANGAFAFSTQLAQGAAYNVTVKTNPTGQTCTVTNPSGTVGTADVTNVSVTCVTPTYAVGGTISGLSGTVVLENNGANDLSTTANGAFAFSTQLAQGAAYNVTVKTNPTGQTCTVTNPSGTVGTADVTNVSVTCVTPTHAVGGTISGLSGTVVLENNGANDLSTNANGAFAFSTHLAQGAAYNVTVKTNPTGQTCTVTNPSGTVGTADVTNVSVACVNQTSNGSASDNFNRANGNLGANWTDMTDGGLAISSQVVVGTNGAYSGDIRTGETYASDQSSQIEVTSTQLSGGQWIGAGVRAQNSGQSLYLGLYFWNNGNPELMLFKRISGNWTQLGASSFQGALAAGTQLTLSVSGSTLSFSQNGVVRITATDTSLTGGAPAVMAFGTPQGDNWVGVSGNSSAPTHAVGGTISGLSGTVVLENNGANDLSATANGAFAFSTQLAQGAAYNVTVKTNPTGQTCTVTNPSGTVGTADVTNVSVTCVNQVVPTHAVGGTISGLSGTVVLENNGANDLSTSANGAFAFSTQLAQGAAYNVTVKTNPTGQTCTVTNPSGTVGTADVTNVSVACVNQTGNGSVSDNFNRANGNLGANWTDMTDGGLAISSQVVVGTNGAYSGDIRTGETYASDQSSQIEVTSTQLSGGQWIGAGVRAQNSGQNLYLGLYFWNNGNPELMLFKRISGNWTQLGASSFQGALAAGTQLTLSVSGSTLSFSQNGVVRITATDTSLTGGAPAVMAFGTPQGDNWVGVSGSSSAPTHAVGGTISGLSGTVVLENNGANDLSTSANGAFAFSTQLAQGAAYNVTVKTNPTGQTCTVTNPSGTVGTADVTNVSVACVNQVVPTHAVGGTISGLSGTVVLENNGANDLSTSANGAFAFSTQLGPGRRLQRHRQDQPNGADLHRHEPLGHRGHGRRHQRLGRLREPGRGVLAPVREHRRQQHRNLLVHVCERRGRDPDVARSSPDSPRSGGRAQFPLCASRRAGTRYHIRRRHRHDARARCPGPVQPHDHRTDLLHRPLVREQSQRRERAVRDLHDEGARALGSGESFDDWDGTELVDRLFEVRHRSTGPHPEAPGSLPVGCILGLSRRYGFVRCIRFELRQQLRDRCELPGELPAQHRLRRCPQVAFPDERSHLDRRRPYVLL